MKIRRIVPIAITAVLALCAAISPPVGAQDPSGSGASTTDSAAPGTTPSETLPVPTTILPVPPAVNEEIAAVLEAERRSAAVEEAKAVAAVQQAEAQAMVATAQSALDAAKQKVADAQAVVAERQSDLDAVSARLAEAQDAVGARRNRAAEIGVEMYTATGSERDPRTAMTVALLANDEIPDASTAKAFRDVVSEAAFSDLESARGRVEKVKVERSDAAKALEDAVAVMKDLEATAASFEAELRSSERSAAAVKAKSDKRIASAAAEAPSLSGRDMTGGLGILGDPLVPAADLAAFARKYGRPSPGIDLDRLAETFIAEGKAEGVRSDVAWIQSIIETGWFSFAGSMVKPSDFNYAGIGACDSCSRGTIFKDETEGVRSQVQLLRTYATKGLTTADLANPPPRLAPERSFVRGCCSTWMKLSGVWATGPGYGIKILTLYNQLLSFAAARRAS